MKRILVISFAIFSILGAMASVSASSILDAMRKQLLSKPAVETFFTINGGQGGVQGSIIMSGSSFTMSTPQLKVWYDGKTQWTYLDSSGEVSITEPTAEELMASNPFAILSSYSSHYKSRRLEDNNGRKCVGLTPVDKNAGIEQITVIADKSGTWPEAINIKFDDNRQIDLVINKIAGIAKPSEKIFRYDPKLQPANEIIDLR